MSGAQYLAILMLASGWVIYNLFLWWVGYEEQVRPTMAASSRVGPVPGWLAWLCGIHGGERTLNLPLAIAQLSAEAGILLVVGVLILVVVGAAGWLDSHLAGLYSVLAPHPALVALSLALSPFVPCVLAELTARYLERNAEF